MSLLILSHVGDIHSQAVASALRRFGVHSETFCFDEFPLRSTITYDLQSEGPILHGPLAEARLDDFAVVWNRRGWDPAFSSELDGEDQRIVAPICKRFSDEMRLSPPGRQTWVNSRQAQLLMRSKALQLRLAKQVGFKVPNTLISNDPVAVRDFLSAPGDFIVKALSPMSWTEEDRLVWLPTTGISLAEVGDDLSVQSCPMVYQERVAKLYELRIIVFGKRILWIKLHSQEAGLYKDDWRHALDSRLKVEAIDPPAGLERRILDFCDKAGLLHASFDLAVAEDGSAIFFEVNEQGQTLWVEDLNPDIPVLENLVTFLADPLGRQPPAWAGEPIRLGDHLRAEA